MDLLRSPEFATHVKSLLAEHHVPGVAIAIVKDGETVSAGFGQASIEPAVPFEADTLQDIASASKSITAASVALMVADNENFPEVQWDSVVSDLLPEDFVMPDESYTRSVTVDDILSHRSGMPRCVYRNTTSLTRLLTFAVTIHHTWASMQKNLITQ